MLAARRRRNYGEGLSRWNAGREFFFGDSAIVGALSAAECVVTYNIAR